MMSASLLRNVLPGMRRLTGVMSQRGGSVMD